MSTFIGALLDVSRSMEASIGDGVDEEGGTWVRSVFQVMDDLVKHDISQSNHIFSVCLGASSEEYSIFDSLRTIQESQRLQQTQSEGKPIHEIIDMSLAILERNGANKIRSWAEISTILEVITSLKEAQFILNKLKSDESFVRRFVRYLPVACKLGTRNPVLHNNLYAVMAVMDVGTMFCTTFRQATREEIEEVIAKVRMDMLKGVDDNSVFTVREASNIIHGSIDEKELTHERARELLKMVDPYIYGRTPLYRALTVASGVFLGSIQTYPDHHRLLFVLTDGDATDEGNIDSIKSQLSDAKVIIVGCYICRSSAVSPRRLYNTKSHLPKVPRYQRSATFISRMWSLLQYPTDTDTDTDTDDHNDADEQWEEGAKFLFNLSSTIPTELITKAIFVKQGWEIDISNNETKLFVHVNHPDHLKDACNLARNAVCCQDTLSDLLVSIDLDRLINQNNSNVKAHKQKGATCYANASAAVLHLAMHRILGRDGGYPKFEELRDSMIDQHGIEAKPTFSVLQAICPRYNLHCKEIDDVNGAMEAITAKRPVVAKFRLTDVEWDSFRRFYQENPTGILRKNDLDIRLRISNASTIGHAVVLTSFNSECFRLMNSWGDDWGDLGFFRVENAEVLDLKFIDVYWIESDLSQQERNYYDQHGSKVAEKLMNKLKALQVATFPCPGCRQPSNVTEFTGTLSRAICPKCNHTFSSNDGDGNILALNMYLTSLSR